MALTTPSTATGHTRRMTAALIGTTPRISSSVVVWLGLVAYLAVVKVLSLTLVPITFRSAGQESLFSWTTLAVIAALGLVGVWCAARTGFPAAWDGRITNRQRLLIPVLI